MNIQNVQIQAFLERVQSKIMRKIEDEYYCGGNIFHSQEQLDQFKQIWKQKLMQQFVLQNQVQLQKDISSQNDDKPSKINKKQNDSLDEGLGSKPRKQIKKELKSDNELQDSNQSQTENAQNIPSPKELNTNQQGQDGQGDNKQSDSQIKDNNQKDQKQMEEPIKQQQQSNKKEGEQEEEEDLLEKYLQYQNMIKIKSKEEEVGGDETNKQDNSCNFSLNSDDLEDVSDQIIDEGYFNDFDNYLIGYIGKERKTKKKCKEQNKPITSIDFQQLIGNINKQEVIISSLRANFIDCRK